MPSFGYSFSGSGAIVADSVTSTGRITGAGFTSTTEGSAAVPAYNFTAATNQGMASVAAVKIVLAAGGASQMAIANGAIDTEGGATLRANSRFALANPTAAALAASQNDYAGPSGGNLSPIWRLTPSAAWSVTGITAREGGTFLLIENAETTAGRNITLPNEDVLSAAANRILGPNAASVVIPPGGAAQLFYDATSTRWRAFPLF